MYVNFCPYFYRKCEYGKKLRYLRHNSLFFHRPLWLMSVFNVSLFSEHCQHHWFPQTPCRGSGYRCLRINHKIDPLIGKAACSIRLTQEELSVLLPRELTVWVDPYEVSYRIGEDGSTCVLYESLPPLPRSASSTDKGPSYKVAVRTGRSSRSTWWPISFCPWNPTPQHTLDFTLL